MKKKKNQANLHVIGGNCDGVTGSCTMIEYQNETHLFELGMIQKHTIEETYNANKKLLEQIKPRKINTVIIGHLHADHICLIPALFAHENCHARVIVPNKSFAILKEMWLDSAWILERDALALSRKHEKYIAPLFTEANVQRALEYVEEYSTNTVHQITENLSIRYSPAGHIMLSQQTEVILKDTVNKTILFTSDLGNLTTQNERFFVEPFQPVGKANIVIGECTYSAKERSISRKDYFTDMQKIKSVIQQYCIDNHNRVLIPTFSLDRMPYMMWIIYSLFKDDEMFATKVLIDSPLAIRLLRCYQDILTGDVKKKFEEMMQWENFEFIYFPEDSKAAIASKKSVVCLSSSGMLLAGRSVKWVASILPNENDCILFCGYTVEGSLGWRIKNGNTQKTISINGKPYKNKANIINLKSFSGHMNRNDLLKYYSSIVADKIYLVHSDDNKISFKEDLQEMLSKELKTTKVIATNRSTKITI